MQSMKKKMCVKLVVLMMLSRMMMVAGASKLCTTSKSRDKFAIPAVIFGLAGRGAPQAP